MGLPWYARQKKLKSTMVADAIEGQKKRSRGYQRWLKLKKQKKREPSTTLDRSVNRFGYASYNDYLQSAHWKRLCATCKANTCYCCDAGPEAKLSLHHITYVRLCRERPKDVVTLCGSCHEAVHTLIKSGIARPKQAHETYRRLVLHNQTKSS